MASMQAAHGVRCMLPRKHVDPLVSSASLSLQLLPYPSSSHALLLGREKRLTISSASWFICLFLLNFSGPSLRRRNYRQSPSCPGLVLVLALLYLHRTLRPCRIPHTLFRPLCPDFPSRPFLPFSKLLGIEPRPRPRDRNA